MMRASRTQWIASAVTVLLAVSCVRGGTVTQKMDLTFSSEVLTNSGPTYSLQFNEFDAALGKLTAVGLSYNGDYKVAGNDPFPVRLLNTDIVNKQTATVLSDDLMAFYKDNNKGLALGANFPTQLKAGPYTIGPLATYDVPLTDFNSGTVAVNKSITDANDLATFVGNGTFNIYGGIVGQEWETDNTAVTVNAVRDGTITTGTLELIYTYTAVPEPTSYALSLVAVLAILLSRAFLPKVILWT